MSGPRVTKKALDALKRRTAMQLAEALKAVRTYSFPRTWAERQKGVSASEVARRLNAAGLPTRRGTGKWSAKAVLEMWEDHGDPHKNIEHSKAWRKRRELEKRKERDWQRFWPKGVWINGSDVHARPAQRLRAYILPDGTAISATGRQKGKVLITGDPKREAERRRGRRRYTAHLKEAGRRLPYPRTLLRITAEHRDALYAGKPEKWKREFRRHAKVEIIRHRPGASTIQRLELAKKVIEEHQQRERAKRGEWEASQLPHAELVVEVCRLWGHGRDLADITKKTRCARVVAYRILREAGLIEISTRSPKA